MRSIQGDPRNGGKACSGNLKETKSCFWEMNGAIDCEFTEWSAWDSNCNNANSPFTGKDGNTCGKGVTTRTRRIRKYAQASGKACQGHLVEAKECEDVSCRWEATEDCKWDDWKAWGS